MTTQIQIARFSIEDAIWRGDDAFLQKFASCECCCDEHTYLGCPARRWHGCRGQHTPSFAELDIQGWAAHYARHRGMTFEEFLGQEK